MKFLRVTIPIMIAVVALFVGVLRYLDHLNSISVQRAQRLALAIQALRVGISDYGAARAIAVEYGAVPYENHYGTADCADGYFERCAYMIPANDSVLHRMERKYPILGHLGLLDWGGTAFIYIQDGLVKELEFSIVYTTTNGQLRGFGAVEYPELPAYRAVQAVISSSYSIQRNDVDMGNRPRDHGFELETAVTPAATSSERKRAWHFDFGCLAARGGCGDLCKVMPDAWRDFYDKRGHFDVEKYGVAYRFCSEP